MCAKFGLHVIALMYLTWTFQNVQGYSSGAPWATCLTMFPKHRRQRQATTCPFEMTSNTSRYSPSEIIQLDISASISGHMLKGIQIRARPKYGDTERIVGQFSSWPLNKTQAIDCLGGKKNMITHNNNIQVPSIQLVWMAPNTSVGDIEFVISFVEDFKIFWVDQIFELSATVIVDEPPIEQKEMIVDGTVKSFGSASCVRKQTVLCEKFESTKPRILGERLLSPIFEIIDWSECGKSKGCFLYPRTCTGHDCYAAVTYRVVNGSVEFEMFGSEQGYVAVGFSEDKLMGDDETITCTTFENDHAIQRGYNHEALYNERQFKHGLFDIQGTYKDGRLYCRFTRPLSLFVYIGEGHTSRKHYDLTKEYYLMLAWGPIYDAGTEEVMGIHVELPPVTQKKVNFKENTVVRGSSLPLTKQIHGALMLIAWMWFISIGTIIARHFKDGFRNKIICGTKLWFQIHRSLLLLTWLLTVASFVLIFVVVGKLTENAKIHGYLGITVMAASTLQVVMGLLRPKSDSKIRNFFNWGHWFLGKSTHIIAGVAFFFAFNSDMIPQPQTRFANIVLGVYIGQQVLWEIWFDIDKKCSVKKASERYELNDMSKTKQQNGVKKTDDYPTAVRPPHSPDRALALYITCIMTITAASLASVFLF